MIPKRPRKYGNKPATVDGIRFDSRAEARRWQELKLLERAGEIAGLERQVRFSIDWNGSPITTYVADFVYIDCRTGARIVEDIKGVATPEFKLKAKLFEANYGFPITVVKA